MSKKRNQKGVSTTEANVIYVFVDECNLRQGEKTKGRYLDYKKVEEYIKQRYKASSVQIFYYTSYPGEGTRSYDVAPRHNYYRYLKTELGIKMRKKMLKRVTVVTKDGTEVVEKGNMDVELVVDAMHTKDEYNNAVLLSGDSDFLALVTYLQRQGKKVYVGAFKGSISKELKEGADEYIDLAEIPEDIWGGAIKTSGLPTAPEVLRN